MSTIRNYIRDNLLAPLKQYPTVIQDTMLNNIADRLEQLYDYTLLLPSIVSPNKNRLDIIKAIADQFLFTVRNDGSIEEQVDILTNILVVYSKRGSIDTIENMWQYYGGKLPKDVQVIIPSYELFRYSISKFSGTHRYQDNETYRPGVYEIKLVNNTYPISDLKKFLLEELVAAGNYIYFTNSAHISILGDNDTHYKYNVDREIMKEIRIAILKQYQGFTYSGHNQLSRKSEDSAWSGRASLFLELTISLLLGTIDFLGFNAYDDEGFIVTYMNSISDILYRIVPYTQTDIIKQYYLYCTDFGNNVYISRDLYDAEGNLVTSPYPGYFVLNYSLLGREV